MNRPMPSRILASEMRNWPISKPKKIRLEPVADVGAGKAPLQEDEGHRQHHQQQGQRELGQSGERLAAGRVEAEPGLEYLATGRPASLGSRVKP